ncbi:hypothetical protein LDENG_00121080 [Lucifuga dentata]|nr:hypothetical protein LDENG_00121080 [Lucifuga dentata]
MSDEEGKAQSKAAAEPKARQQIETKRGEESDNADDVTMEAAEEEKEVETPTSDRWATAQTSDSSESDNKEQKSRNGQTSKQKESIRSIRGSGSASGPSAEPRRRTPCPYGKDCYRKNPLHFQECCHPGDSDYEEEEEETDEADRPECPYGTDCYRKNPLHRKEYKHTKRPARTTRTVPKKATVDEDEDDKFDDDDSFINDDSEDAGDDSDYVAPNSDDSDKEDIRRLQKEAKAFMKRQK